MNKTIYVRDADVEVWDKAKELAGEKLAPIIVQYLKRYIAESDAIAKGFSRIELEFQDIAEYFFPKKVAFTGRWITEVDLDDDDGPFTSKAFSIGETPKGNVVVFYKQTRLPDEELEGQFEYYSSFGEAAKNPKLTWVIREAVEAKGVSVVELDI